MMKIWICRFLTLKCLLYFACIHLAHSAYVSKMKGKKLLISIEESDEIEKGEFFYLVNENDKKKALIQIIKVKGKKALALVRKGKAKRGFTLQPRRRRTRTKVQKPRDLPMERQESSSEQNQYANDAKKTSFFGIIGGMNLYNLQAQENAQNSSIPKSDLTGQGLSGKLIGNFSFLNYFQVDLGLGFKQFSVKSTEKACSSGGQDKSCETLIQYITGSVALKLVSPQWNMFSFFLGGGYESNFPISKQTVGPYIGEKSITTLGLTFVTTGLNIFIKDSMAIPLSFEYGFFPSSKSITGTYMKVTAGLLF